jgi:hypothetical protein
MIREHRAMHDYSATGRHDRSLDARNPFTATGDVPDAGCRRLRQLEKEDIVILVLSAILVVATFWLATKIL